MSRITRCPSCETLFKVVPDQLRLSQGWVRCGSCGTVFDAGEQMQHTEPRPGSDSADAGHSGWPLLLDDAAREGEGLRPPSGGDASQGIEQYAPVVVDDQTVTPAYPHLNEATEEPLARDAELTTTVVLTNASFATPEESSPASLMEGVQPLGQPAAVAEPSTDAPGQAQPLPTMSQTPAVASVDFVISQLDAELPAPADDAQARDARSDHARDIASHIIRRRNAGPADKAEMPALVKASAEVTGAPPPLREAAWAAPARSEDAERTERDRASRAKAPARKARPRKPAPAPVVQPPEDDVPSFVRDAQRRQFWRQPWVRVSLVLALVLVGALLALRWVHDRRDWLAASYPDAKPGLVTLCGVLGCEVKPYRLLDGVAIEGSSFNRLPSGEFRLNLSVRNIERLELATPAFELSLTDAQDQVLLKRVLQPGDVKAPQVLLPRRDWSGGLTLSLDPQLSSQVAGYRVLAFYP
ncbi:hypothetical protein CCO03_15740 [Comamonas serinivorans]|uniref:Zinc finger/thioredoxin putative domain-containing protein n=1 Tax=Comamonas serinivorans TaxID=1082851 RepID=A0A1Y0ER01_9BURK|nr:zinc-ribbon and DUF3426 domain-containing protein [Comamonas serinivorans]ARU05928.1 hypothetical protein CCO03_15740 [Comamonas serinivorans]